VRNKLGSPGRACGTGTAAFLLAGQATGNLAGKFTRRIEIAFTLLNSQADRAANESMPSR
jgi:hypothetical protein